MTHSVAAAAGRERTLLAMSTPQSGIFALGTTYQYHLEFAIRPDVSHDSVLASLAALCEPHVSGGATNLVVGFGSALWEKVRAGSPQPAGLGPFAEVVGKDGHVAPATQHDVWAWVHGGSVDAVYDTANNVACTLSTVATLEVDCPTFVYHDSRDLTGFIDGSANPTPAEAAVAACIPAGRPGEGGSHVMTQRWVHDLGAFGELSVPDQEGVIGRTKLDSVALTGEALPADAHVALLEIHDAEGNERPIYRRSTPYGTVNERGLFFVAFSCERDRFDVMVAEMYGSEGRQIRDHLLDFSVAVTGAYYFAPSIEELLQLGVS